MGLFGALIRTIVNVAALPITLPVAVAKDAADFACGDRGGNTSRVVEKLKREADEDK